MHRSIWRIRSSASASERIDSPSGFTLIRTASAARARRCFAKPGSSAGSTMPRVSCLMRRTINGITNAGSSGATTAPARRSSRSIVPTAVVGCWRTTAAKRCAARPGSSMRTTSSVSANSSSRPCGSSSNRPSRCWRRRSERVASARLSASIRLASETACSTSAASVVTRPSQHVRRRSGHCLTMRPSTTGLIDGLAVT